jgi:serine/threonine-protein kinase
MADPLDIPRGTVIAGKYRVGELLGQGGMGSVYLAVNEAIGRKVALKLLDPQLAGVDEFKHRFQMEARAAAMIGHPGIVDVLDMGETAQGAPFIVMEFLEGATLRTHLKQNGPLTPGAAVVVLAPVLDALAAAHAAHVIHRDLKPANLFLVARPVQGVKILDFGVSKFGGPAARSVSTAGITLGTPAFMAPEQMRGSRDLGPATDLYALGAVLYFMLSCRLPFEAESDLALGAMLVNQPHRPLTAVRPDVPPALAALVDALLAKLPAERPGDAASVKRALLAAVKPDPGALWKYSASWLAAPKSVLLAPATHDAVTAAQTEPAVVEPAPQATRSARPAALVAEPPPFSPPERAPPRSMWLLKAAGGALILAVGAGLGLWSPWSADEPEAPRTASAAGAQPEKGNAPVADGAGTRGGAVAAASPLTDGAGGGGAAAAAASPLAGGAGAAVGSAAAASPLAGGAGAAVGSAAAASPLAGGTGTGGGSSVAVPSSTAGGAGTGVGSPAAAASPATDGALARGASPAAPSPGAPGLERPPSGSPTAAGSAGAAPQVAAASKRPTPKPKKRMSADPVYEVFIDHGAPYVRAGAEEGLAIGSRVQVVGPKAGGLRPFWSDATAMEVMPHLTRLNLDAGVAALRGTGELFAYFEPRPKARPAEAKPLAPASDAGPLKPR